MPYVSIAEERTSTVTAINRLAGQRQRILWEGPKVGQTAAYRERLQHLQDEIDRLWAQRREELAGRDCDQ